MSRRILNTTVVYLLVKDGTPIACFLGRRMARMAERLTPGAMVVRSEAKPAPRERGGA